MHNKSCTIRGIILSTMF